ncbi:MAG: MYXO-CTERM sorting domain-containing protein [Kofleriaceae bacterium]
MRRILVALVVLGATTASAEPLPPAGVVWQNRVVRGPVDATALATISHKLYLNNCLPYGCAVSPGADNSLTNQSSIAVGNVVLEPWKYGTAHWDKLVACVRETFEPFNIEIVTDDPGNTAHFEVMVGGTSTQLHPGLNAGGVAPFVSCDARVNNVITFVFANLTSDLEFLCGAVAQEAGHAWGLDHELNAKDPMTYLDLGSAKRFQDESSACGESTARACACGGSTQNSVQYLLDTFGASDLAMPTFSFVGPTPGQWVKPQFNVLAEMTSQLEPQSAALTIDGEMVGELATGPFMFKVPSTLTPGEHTLTLSGFDSGGRPANATATVTVTDACAATADCDDGFYCMGGYCVPDSSVAGGLGAECANNESCATGMCGKRDDDQLCTAACEQGTCPSGFECLGGDGGVCWPEAVSTGGCSATDSPTGWLLAGLAIAPVLVLRRRRRRRA